MWQKTSTDFGSDSQSDGSIKYRYDKNGNLRFQQDAQQNVDGRFTYFKYDIHNRLIEEGVYSDDSYFDHANEYYDDPSFPPDTDSNRAWKIKQDYDEDFINSGTNYSAGRLTQTQVNTDGNDAAEITTKYKYDKFGQVSEKHVQIDGLDEKIIQFEYDNLGNLTKTIYPSSATVDRTYNEQNQLDTVKAAGSQ